MANPYLPDPDKGLSKDAKATPTPYLPPSAQEPITRIVSPGLAPVDVAYQRRLDAVNAAALARSGSTSRVDSADFDHLVRKIYSFLQEES